MKITISIPQGIYDKLERDRGMVPRSTYIQSLIRGSKGAVLSEEGPKLDSSDEYELKERIVVKPKGSKKELPRQEISKHITYFKKK